MVIGQQFCTLFDTNVNRERTKSTESMQKSMSVRWPNEFLHKVYLWTWVAEPFSKWGAQVHVKQL